MNYLVTIGLEVHVQLRTATKMFCACPNRYGDEPNTNVCPVCLGYPGVLPVPNRAAIRNTLIAGLVTHCRLATWSKFDRKAYCYPDMPKNYQISQYDLPLCEHGWIEISGQSLRGEVGPRRIGLTRIHLEEDVAKSTHFARSSGIDFNRAGVPLMEIVSEPELASADEAYAYLQTLKQVIEYAGIADCNMERGQMRCDVNVSVRPAGQEALNLKTELKNLGSIKAVHQGLEFEIERQIDLLEAGEPMVQTTRGWNADRGETYLLRTKEDASDYRYFPCPDLMPMSFTEAFFAELRAGLPPTPEEMRQRLLDLGLTAYDAAVLAADKAVADYFLATVDAGAKPKPAANWIMSELLRELGNEPAGIAACKIAPAQLADLFALVDAGTINGKIAKEVFAAMYQSGDDPAAIVKARGLEQIADTGAVEGFVQQAIAANPKPVEEFRAGKDKALQFLVGQVMKLSRGKANPQLAAELLRAKLSE